MKYNNKLASNGVKNIVQTTNGRSNRISQVVAAAAALAVLAGSPVLAQSSLPVTSGLLVDIQLSTPGLGVGGGTRPDNAIWLIPNAVGDSLYAENGDMGATNPLLVTNSYGKPTMRFDGNDALLLNGSNTTINLAGGDFTVMFAYSVSNPNKSDGNTLFSSSYVNLEGYVYGATQQVYIGNGGSFAGQPGSNALLADTVYVGAVVRSGGILKTYLNGVEDSSATHTEVLSQNHWWLGMRTGGGNNLAGDLSSFVLYDRALNATELEQVWTTLYAAAGPSTEPVTSTIQQGVGITYDASDTMAVYHVQTSNDLSQGSWTDLSAQTGSGFPTTVFDPFGSATKKFYRVVSVK